MPATVTASQPDRAGGGWFSSPLAQHLMRREQRDTLPLLASCYGRCGIYLRCSPDAPLELPGSLLQRTWRLHQTARGQAGRSHAPQQIGGDIRCDEDMWPLQRETLDLVYLLHALEVSGSPQQLLSEIERVLVPGGAVLVVALNPYSPWRLRWAGSGVRPLSRMHVRELLAEAGLDVVQQRGVGPLWPGIRGADAVALGSSNSPDLLGPLRAGQLLFARKRRPGLTPLRHLGAAVSLKPGMRPG